MTVHLGDMFEAVAAAVPERTAVSCGEERLTYRELDEQSNRLANHFVEQGFAAGEHVAIYMMNRLEFVVSFLGLLKARLVPININYRYTGPELDYLFDDADVAGVIVTGSYLDQVRELAHRFPLREILVVADEGGGAGDRQWPEASHVSDWTESMAAAATTPVRVAERSPDDRYILYTGGTTGMPKGVIWRQEDFYFAAVAGSPNNDDDGEVTPEAVAAAAAARTPVVSMLSAPLMHGAASYALLGSLYKGDHRVVLRKFDVDEVLKVVDRERVSVVMVVGDAMARPLLDAVLDRGDQYDLSCWRVLGSGGALLSQSVQDGFRERFPGIAIMSGFGSSESGANGLISLDEQGRMILKGSRSLVLDERLQPVAPGSGQIGVIANTGNVPLGYYKDEAKSAATFPVIDGRRWVLSGDMGEVEADGTIVVHGRGSVSINTGGEKVFPEEVEQALKAHASVMDCLVVGIPDERWGQRVAAVVQLREGKDVSSEELREFSRSRIAGYKVPAVIAFSDHIMRSPAGKADYRWAKSVLTGQ